MEYKITHIWNDSINNVHHITVEYNGNSYSVIFGRYINGGFFSIPNWGVGGELGQFCDTFWNEESLCRVLTVSYTHLDVYKRQVWSYHNR